MTSEDEWRAAIAATVAEFGKLDILVNDAGISGSAVDDLFDTAAWERLMAVNATGTFLGMKFAIPEMQKAGGGVDRQHLVDLRASPASAASMSPTTPRRARCAP